MYLARKIIEKCEKSSRDWRSGATGGRTMRIEESDYEACGKHELIVEARMLEENGLIKIAKWITVGSDIDKIAYRVENLPEFYDIVEKDEGEKIIPKQVKVENYLMMINRELREGYEHEWIEKYILHLKEKVENGEGLKETENIENKLSCLRGLDRLEEPMIKRAFSIRYLHGSKVFEKTMERFVISTARKYNENITSDMDDKTVLRELLLEDFTQELVVKGPLRLKIWKGSEAKRIDLSDFVYGIVLNSQSLKHVMVEVNQPTIRRVISIENKANFMAAPYKEDTLYIFSHGYYSPLDRAFIKKLYRALEGKGVEYFHSGDLDYGGVKIFDYIQKKIIPEIKPLKMDVATLHKYWEYTDNIEPETLEKLKKTSVPLLDDLIKEMVETGRGLEQESFLAE